MPCNGDYLAPSHREQQLRETATLYMYVLGALGKHVPKKVVDDAASCYGGADYVPALCEELRGMDDATRETVVHARTHTARLLANWWESHLAADAEREKREAEEAETARLREQALSKLTDAERLALRLKG